MMKVNPGFSLSSKKAGLLFLIFLLIVFVMLIISPNSAAAASLAQTEPPPPLEDAEERNQECLQCHQVDDMVRELESGEQLYLTVNPDLFNQSVHGSQGYACVQCHVDFPTYPHPELAVETAREYTLERTRVCITCHTGQGEEYAKGRHAQAYIAGDDRSATCVDCHSSHQTKQLADSKIAVAQTCQACHAQIYDVYKDSVHGAALLEENNSDVPTCSDCHESHDNTGPGDPGYVLFSPQICGDCHADEQLMSKYDVNTDVFDTYVADFHGSTVVIFEQIAPDQETNKPVCIDCHGVHNILPPDDENSTVMKENLVTTCQRCHPEATTDFSASWLSHYRPDLHHEPLVYFVNIFYWVLIPMTVGGMLIFIGTQMWRKYVDKSAKEKHNG